MTKTTICGGLVAALVVLALALPSFSEEGDAGEQGSGDPMQAFYEAMAKVNENHEWLAFMEGTFDTTAKFWMGPGEPLESTGKATNTWMFGKRFIRQQYEGAWEGSTFRGEGTFGYSNATKQYQTLWMDDMSTHMDHQQGTREGDKVTLAGEQHTPFGKIAVRNVYTKVSGDEYVIEGWWTMPPEMGGEMKVMEIRYKRAAE